MKKIILSIVVCMIATVSSFAQYTNSSTRYQRGYMRSNGTYVAGHYKTRINCTNHDNFSTRSNRNMYTGRIGSRARDYSSRAYNYGRGKTIHSGSRGGQYYISTRGRKTYVPKRF